MGTNSNNLEDSIQRVSYEIVNEYDNGWKTSITWKLHCKLNFFFFLYGSISVSVGSETFQIVSFDLFSKVKLPLEWCLHLSILQG